VAVVVQVVRTNVLTTRIYKGVGVYTRTYILLSIQVGCIYICIYL
jgi:hypothetical protein